MPQGPLGVQMCQASHILGAGCGIQGTRLMTSRGKDSEPRHDQDLEARISRQKTVRFTVSAKAQVSIPEMSGRPLRAARAGSSLTTSSVKAVSSLGLPCTASCPCSEALSALVAFLRAPRRVWEVVLPTFPQSCLSCLSQPSLFPGACPGSSSKVRFS